MKIFRNKKGKRRNENGLVNGAMSASVDANVVKDELNKETKNNSLERRVDANDFGSRKIGDELASNCSLIFENRNQSEWLSTKEAAHFLSLSENALRIMVHRGQIKVHHIGRRLRFRKSDCLALFQKKGV